MKKFTAIIALLLLVSVAFANKTSVRIDAPEKEKKGEEITVIIQVSHSANSKMHHTNWVTLALNGKEVQRWEYSKKALPPSENFTLEYKFVPDENTSVTAQGNCNIHGSKGPQTVMISVH
jgi:desulfoferrodoxin (superoxide reductase-like protein)